MGTIPPLQMTEQEADEALESMGKDKKEKLQTHARMLHGRGGHTPYPEMEKLAKQRGAHPVILALLRKMRCPVCDEQRPPQPRHQVTWNVIPEKWEVVESDLAEWIHPETEKKYKLIVFVDVAQRIRSGRVIVEFNPDQARNATASEVLDAFFDEWVKFFHYPKKVRVDPEGAWMSTQTSEVLGSLGIDL